MAARAAHPRDTGWLGSSDAASGGGRRPGRRVLGGDAASFGEGGDGDVLCLLTDTSLI